MDETSVHSGGRQKWRSLSMRGLLNLVIPLFLGIHIIGRLFYQRKHEPPSRSLPRSPLAIAMNAANVDDTHQVPLAQHDQEPVGALHDPNNPFNVIAVLSPSFWEQSSGGADQQFNLESSQFLEAKQDIYSDIPDWLWNGNYHDRGQTDELVKYCPEVTTNFDNIHNDEPAKLNFLLVRNSEELHLYPRAFESVERSIQQLLAIYSSTLPRIIISYNPVKRQPEQYRTFLKRWFSSIVPEDRFVRPALDDFSSVPGDLTGELWLLPSYPNHLATAGDRDTQAVFTLHPPSHPSHNAVIIDCREILAPTLIQPPPPVVLYPPVVGSLDRTLIDAAMHSLDDNVVPESIHPIKDKSNGPVHDEALRQGRGNHSHQQRRRALSALSTAPPQNLRQSKPFAIHRGHQESLDYKRSLARDRLMASLNGLITRNLFNSLRDHAIASYDHHAPPPSTDMGLVIWVLFAAMSQTVAPSFSAERTLADMLVPDDLKVVHWDDIVLPVTEPRDAACHDAPWIDDSKSTNIHAHSTTPGLASVPGFPQDSSNGFTIATHITPGLAAWLPEHDLDIVKSVFGVNSSDDERLEGTGYAVVSIGTNLHRRRIQDFLWKSENLLINHFAGLDFSDFTAVSAHFGHSLNREEIETLMHQHKSVLLVQQHTLAAQYACDSVPAPFGKPVESVFILEDDAIPLPDLRSRLEQTIDLLQGLRGRDGWGWHSTGGQDMFDLKARMEFTRLRQLQEFNHLGLSSDVDPLTLSQVANLLPAYGSIVFHSGHVYGSISQIINCNRFREVYRTYFASQNEKKFEPAKLDVTAFRSPASQLALFASHHNIANPSWRLFASDLILPRMYWDKPDQPLPMKHPTNSELTSLRRSFTSISYEPLVTLSAMEWTTSTGLHDNEVPRTYWWDALIPDPRWLLRKLGLFQHDPPPEKVAIVLENWPLLENYDDFPSMEDVFLDEDQMGYFRLHMWINRKALCRRALMDWTRAVVLETIKKRDDARCDDHDTLTTWASGTGKGTINSLANKLLLSTFDGIDGLDRRASEWVSRSDHALPYHAEFYFPCLVGDAVPSQYRQLRQADVEVGASLGHRTRRDQEGDFL